MSGKPTYEELEHRIKVLDEELINSKQVAEALRESEEKFAESFLKSPIPMAITSMKDGRYVDVNEAFAKIMGLKREGLMSNTSISAGYITAEQRALFLDEYREKGSVANLELQMRVKGGELRYGLFNSSKITIRGENFFLTMVTDITDHKQAVEALRESEERFRDLFDNSLDLICTHDLEGRFLSINSSGAATFGYTIEELIGKDIRDFVSPSFRHDFDNIYMANIKKHGYATGIMSIQSGKGERRILEYNNTMRTEAGKTHLIRGIVRDITERWKTQRALEKSEKKYRSIFERAVEGIFQYDQAGRFISVNQSMARMCGYDSPKQMMELITNVTSQFFMRSDLSDRLQTILESKGRVENFEHKIYRRDGTDIWVSMNLWAVRDVHGNVIHYEGTQMDISDRIKAGENRRNLEHQLAQSQKMEAIGALAGGIAHDFNNILSGIMGYSELCMNAVHDRPKVHNYMEQVLKAAGRAKDLVQQILTFSRKVEQEKKPLTITPIVKEVVKFMRASLPTTIEIRQTIDENTDTIMADHTQMHQLLMNLCTNAGHVMKETGGLLEIGLKEVVMDANNPLYNTTLPDGHYLELSVRDTGHGISQENLGRIFDPYFTTKKQGEGTGLGLAVVHGIVKEHGGEIRVYSEEGKGTIFRIYLPLIEKQEEDGKDMEEAILRGKGETILFVDDESMVVDLSRELLEGLGYKVVAETDPVHAIEVFKTNSDSFDLVVTDKTMPHMTGFDVIRQVRDIRGDIPVVLCSGFQEKEDMDKLKVLGISQIIAKPTRMSVLAKAIRDVLDKRLET